MTEPMPTPPPDARLSDEHIEQVIGRVLQAGVLIAGTIVSVAGLFYLLRYGAAAPTFGAFHGEPANLRTVRGIVHGAATLHPRAWIQLGLLVLLFTPVARVALLLGAFVLQRDRLYVVIAGVVLALLVVGLTGLAL